ncbi:MAG: glycoside hydrolase family 16 protein [Actinobacteria bacterium]|nr:glycoside hydrolase family 16 protein [Actinomycetota bacterium]
MALIISVLPVGMDVPIARAGPRPQHISPYGRPDEGWVLQFDDEFDGDMLDPSRWSNGFGWGDTADYSQERCAAANTLVGDGVLIQRLDDDDHGATRYTSGCVNTKGKFSQIYGFWEARIKVPRGAGLVGAFWLKPNNESWPPETDIAEVLGTDPRTLRMAVFWRNAEGIQRRQARWNGPDLSDGFHVFGLAWTPRESIWYVDGQERWRTAAGAGAMAARGPFYMMLNAHIGTNFGGTPDGSVIWPAYQLVDYVRVWTAAADRRGLRR